MTSQEFGDCCDELGRLCATIIKEKRFEYTEGSENVLANFYFIAREMGLSPNQVLYVYLRKHISSIAQYCKGTAQSEPIEERIADAINFLRLLYALNKEATVFTKPLV